MNLPHNHPLYRATVALLDAVNIVSGAGVATEHGADILDILRDPDIPDDATPIEVLAYLGMTLAAKLANDTATEAGWYRDPATGAKIKRNFGEVVMLMVTELAEAVEADRKGLMDDKLPGRPGQEVEFADCLIRMFDTAVANDYNVPAAFLFKNRFNRKREDHKLENRGQAGGKRY